jgi:hypothetical protein
LEAVEVRLEPREKKNTAGDTIEVVTPTRGKIGARERKLNEREVLKIGDLVFIRSKVRQPRWPAKIKNLHRDGLGFLSGARVEYIGQPQTEQVSYWAKIFIKKLCLNCANFSILENPEILKRN